MVAQDFSDNGKRKGNFQAAPRSLLLSKLVELSEAECGEVIEYIEVMRSLRREAVDRRLFGDGFARRISAMCDGERLKPPDVVG